MMHMQHPDCQPNVKPKAYTKLTLSRGIRHTGQANTAPILAFFRLGSVACTLPNSHRREWRAAGLKGYHSIHLDAAEQSVAEPILETGVGLWWDLHLSDIYGIFSICHKSVGDEPFIKLV